jgi:hypothetical protein
MLLGPTYVGSPWELIAAVLTVAALVSAAGRMAEAGYIQYGRWSVPRAAMKFLRANSRVSVFSTLGLVIVGPLALSGLADMSATWATAMLVAIGGSLLSWRCVSSVARSGHTEADRLERAGRIAAALTVLEADVGFTGIQGLMKRRFTGGDPKLFRGIEKDFLEIARLALAVKDASNAAARLGVARDLTDAYWYCADSISRTTWRRFEVIATARREGFVSPVLTEALSARQRTRASDTKARSLRDQTAEDIESLKHLGKELVAETTMLATKVGDDYAEASWWKNYLEAERELHAEDGGWSVRQSRDVSPLRREPPGMDRFPGSVGIRTVLAIAGVAKLRQNGALRSLFFLSLLFLLQFRSRTARSDRRRFVAVPAAEPGAPVSATPRRVKRAVAPS